MVNRLLFHEFARGDPQRFYAPFRAEIQGDWQKMNGYTDSPSRAKGERGDQYLTIIAQAVAQAFITFDSAAREADTQTD